ncbi:MAG: ABC transporter substrate-binding protein, partial [bacterium]|nr:ABC transporter substrate-binding protein [bacterium]
VYVFPVLDDSMISSYKKLDPKKPVVEFPINVWIGWLPIVAANHGCKPNEESYFYKNYGFMVNITLIDDPVSARDAFASGKSHVLWGTLDIMALFAPSLSADARTAPKIYQIVDWSNGGDGIVARDNIKSVKDLKGKTIVYAQNSPSQYYANTMLLKAGVQPGEVNHKFTDTPFSAAAAFVASNGKKEQIDAVVSWAPDIYTIPEKVPGTKLLSSTQDDNKVIADTWAVRADFARDNPKIVKGLVEGIFAGMDMLNDASYKKEACKWLGELYGYGEDEITGMINDAHSTNFAENASFFLNADNPANFANTWKNICFVYGELGVIDAPIPVEKVMDASVIKELQKEGKFKGHKDTYK